MARAAPLASKNRTLYAFLSEERFINNADDRGRGEGNNPFGNSASSAAVPTDEKLFGPFPGDTGVYEFDLFGSQKRGASAGSAVVICQYSFEENAFCDASFQLRGGVLVAKGPATFNGSTFTLAVVGGTGSYRNSKGRADFTALGVATEQQLVGRSAAILEAQRIAFTTTAAKPAGGHRSLTIYTKPVDQDFVTNADDLLRGEGNNPFGTHENGRGAKTAPFPGDMTLFSFDVYRDPGLTNKVGTAVITCYYNFGQNALCDASYQVNGGTLFAIGPLNFSAKTFALAVTGGLGSYLAATGDLKADPSGKVAQRLTFALG
ncbi:MAG: hypothetical protein JO186_05250 [Actinobacteria bacterium]|nr:hypothetical protein [Actinomycetota bacterium]MBV8598642.1 hypothetical protein [Actinomycetota bacterium]